jgi:hypothetical protein
VKGVKWVAELWGELPRAKPFIETFQQFCQAVKISSEPLEEATDYYLLFSNLYILNSARPTTLVQSNL